MTKDKMTTITLTEFQRKRIAAGKSVPILRNGSWYRVVPANKTKVQKLKNKMRELRKELKIEMGRRTNGKQQTD